jgi:hypothetical protein
MTDVAFVRAIHAKLVTDGHLPSEKLLNFFSKERHRTVKAHFERKQSESNGAFASAMYQDGLQHSFSDVLTGASLGKRPEELERELRSSEKHLQLLKRKRDDINIAIEIAYWSGRVEVLRRFCSRDTSRIPIYFHPNRFEPSQKYIRG